MPKLTLNKSYYLITLSYIGARYFGWQKQSEFKSIHAAFDLAVKKSLELLNQNKESEIIFHTIGCSRTDARVNALGQRVKLKLVNFDVNPETLKKLINKSLPSDIRIEKIKRVTKEFKVIADVYSKKYIYLFDYAKESTPFNYPYITIFEEELDLQAMKKACSLFIGHHNFKYFSYRHGSDNTTREVFNCEIVDDYKLDFGALKVSSPALIIEGTGFLKQMVRIIMGSLINIGQGKLSEAQIIDALALKGQTRPGFIVPAHGLFLKEISYNEK